MNKNKKRVYTPCVFLLALVLLTIPWAWGSKVGREWAYQALVLVVVACPCALVISTPVTYVAALTAAAQQGILIKGGVHLETLGKVDTVCLDKTGTLTVGSFQVQHGGGGVPLPRREVLSLLAAMESKSSHPMAAALMSYCEGEGVGPPIGARAVTGHETHRGEGVSGVVQGRRVWVGSTRMFDRIGLIEAGAGGE
ncbi:unnamed protein product [Discosporangium mesarthrocarpum]